MCNKASASNLGRELYHAIWKEVGENFFDISRLKNWDSWEHNFDTVIDDEAAALRCAAEMLASLDDPFTKLAVTPESCSSPSADVGVEADKPAEPNDVMAVLTKSNVGYLRIGTFNRKDIADLVEVAVAKIAGCDGVILDLRNNNGGMVQEALECCGFFLCEALLSTLESRHGNATKSERYFLNLNQFYSIAKLPDGSRSDDLFNRRKPLLANKPIVLIINDVTASASEMIIAAIVQNGVAGQVHIVGSGATLGKGICQEIYEFLAGKVQVAITRFRWLAPGGQWLGDCGQTVEDGIAPDTLVLEDHGPEALKVASDELRKMLVPTHSKVQL